MKYWTIIIAVTIITYGCSKDDSYKNTPEYKNEIYLCNKIKDMNPDFDSIFMKVKEIEPDLGVGNILGWMGGVKIKNNKIYISDTKGPAIYVLNMEGKLLVKIGNKGSGPGEYLKIRDFDIDKNGNIYILDASNLRVSIFKDNNEYLRSFPAIVCSNICTDTSGGYFLYNSGADINSGDNVVFHYDKDGNIIDKLCANFSHYQMSGGILFRSFDNSLFICNVSTYLVRRYTLDGQLLKEYNDKPPIFNELNIKGRFPTNEESRTMSTLIGLSIRTNHLLYFQYYRPEPEGNWLDIYYVDGHLLKRSIKINNLYDLKYVADDAYIYFVERPGNNTMFSDNNSAGFKLICYKIKGS